MLALARHAIAAALAGAPAPQVPDGPGVRLLRGAFVTLEEQRGGALRGCIGRVAGDRPLGDLIRSVAVAAACDDPRFPAVVGDELTELRIEISVLSEPTPLEPVDPGKLLIGRDGLLVRRGSGQGVLLPQVATEHGWGPEAFLSAACRKAGVGPRAWREPGTQVFTFQADVFGE